MGANFKGTNIRPWRLLSQFASLTFVLSQLLGMPPFGTYPVLRRLQLPNASCRYINDAPTSCYYYQLQDGLVQGWSDIYLDVIIMLLATVLLVILLGRLWCSWACPFGLTQEGLTYIRERLHIPPVRVKWAFRVLLRRFKYAILFLTILLSMPLGVSALGLTGAQTTLALPFCQVCPAKGFFTVSQQLFGLEPWETVLPPLAVASLLIFLFSAFFVKMAFCRICPMGGVMALLSSVSFPLLRKRPDKCTKCRVCLRVCPMDHDRVYEDMTRMDVGGEDCTLCGRCVEMCPEKGCLSLTYGPKDIITSKRPKRVGITAFIEKFASGRTGGSR